MRRKKRKEVSILAAGLLLIPLCFTTFQAESIDQKETMLEKNENVEQMESQATVYFHDYDTNQNKLIKEPITTLTAEKAFQLREELLQIEELNLNSIEKIKTQIEKLQEWDLLPQSNNLYKIQQKLNNIQINPSPNSQTLQADSVSPNVIICGPAITSFLTIGGPMLPLHVLLFNILEPFWYNTTNVETNFFNGAIISGFIGILPVVAFYCSTTTLINAYGAIIGEKTVFSPFIALMLLHAGVGISVNINSNDFALSVFDWAVGLSVTGLVAYIDIN